MTTHCPVCGRPAFDWSNPPDHKHCSSKCADRDLDQTDRQLERAIVELVEERSPDKTICPSEAARQVRPDDWRDLMERTRLAARRLYVRNEIECTRGGEPVDPWNPGGPIRLSLATPETS
jgi:predicted nucleic acid-binding Zn ribbon protein